MTAPDLKPCPFCGARAACSVGNASFSGVELMGAGTDRPYVWCGTCGSSGSFEDTDAKAVAAWNTRADLADALAAALRDLHGAVCGETGFAQCVRDHSGTAYPWPALDAADEAARLAIAAAKGRA